MLSIPRGLCRWFHDAVIESTPAIDWARTEEPCVLVTNTRGVECESLQLLAEQVRTHMQCAAVVVAPEPAPHPSSAAACPPPSAALSFGQPLALQQHGALGPNTFSITGTTADCILCAVDAKAGLLKRLGFTPVLTVVGVHSGPALSSDVDTNPAVMAARHAAILGVPAMAVCLATTSASAPLEPAATATGHLLAAVTATLNAGGGWQYGATNFPRAHFPFPTRGRWALGRELPLPTSVQAATASSSAARDFAAADCWALGSDDSWLGVAGSSSGSSSSSTASSSIASEAEGQRLLRQAFCEGDLVLCVNVPPTWEPPPTTGAGMASSSPIISTSSSIGSSRQVSSGCRSAFASTRVGVLWHCYQAEALGTAKQTGSNSNGSSNGSNGTSSSSTGGPGSDPESSWQASTADLFGRSLPSQTLGQSHASLGAFVAQDNTSKVLDTVTAARALNGSDQTASADMDEQGRQHHLDLPAYFRLSPGTLLNDHAVKGDVEAIYWGLTSVCALQTWPVGHPFSLTDAAMVHALVEGRDGLPAWLLSNS